MVAVTKITFLRNKHYKLLLHKYIEKMQFSSIFRNFFRKPIRSTYIKAPVNMSFLRSLGNYFVSAITDRLCMCSN